jgi:Na+/H+-dicarboxylate symporter
MMVSQAWSGTAQALLSSWIPILLAVGAIVALLLASIVLVCLRHHLSIVRVFLACVPAGFLGFTTASPSACFGTMLSTCMDDFGVDEDQASFGVPLGMVLCKPASPILLVATVLYCAQAYGGGSPDLIWYLRLGITCLLYAVAVPPVPGGMLACYGMIFATLGVPAQAIGVATALDLLLDNPVACTNVVSLILQVFSAAEGLGAVEDCRLRKSA